MSWVRPSFKPLKKSPLNTHYPRELQSRLKQTASIWFPSTCLSFCWQTAACPNCNCWEPAVLWLLCPNPGNSWRTLSILALVASQNQTLGCTPFWWRPPRSHSVCPLQLSLQQWIETENKKFLLAEIGNSSFMTITITLENFTVLLQLLSYYLY